MEVEYSFLADGAQTSSDGKLFVLGGGIDRIFAANFPTTHPYISLVLKLKLDPSECDREHGLEIELWDPDGNPIGGKVSGKFTGKRAERGEDSFIQLVLNMLGVKFPSAGDYAFKILVDGHHIKTLPLHVVKRSPSTGEAAE